MNVIGPIRAEPDRPAWAQTIFYPFALTARHARGDVLRVQTATGLHDTAEHGEVPLVDVVATHDPETGHVAVFAMNRHVSEPDGDSAPHCRRSRGTCSASYRAPDRTRLRTLPHLPAHRSRQADDPPCVRMLVRVGSSEAPAVQ